ncbi:DUF4760 domain-containing protein [Accumulibacter sp.]|uniref:DUF4760 domain-containing protein n=1 Tax=Accumulibacter sp. TaxID=2053492 RepID=UPI002CA71CDF|nr:DUF4760 domain-containing protein [Accumulibacter sp.]HRF05245.1 DUF4760 domain-containing protein [Accumulibacter sp.]
MTDYQMYSLLLSGSATLITLCGLIYAGIQLKKTKEQLQATYKISAADHDWNRRMAAQAALSEYNQSITLSGLQSTLNYLNCTEAIPLSKIQKGFTDHPDLQNELHQLLNFYEGLARGVSHRVYDVEVIKAGRRSAMINTLRAFNSYIESRRKESSPTAWTDLEALVAEWVADEKRKPQRRPTDEKY